MRTISLWQPWAELIRRGLKQWETRSWPLEYRGVIAVHAAKRKFRSEDIWPQSRQQMVLDGVDPFDLEYGCVLCFADLVECVKTEVQREKLSRRESLYGNYEDGRYCWRLENIISLAKPIPLVGHQGIFHWPEGKAIYEMAPR
jgi:hypothetical protein